MASESTFDDSTWKSGPGPLGYSSSNPSWIKTKIGTGNGVTTYFRKGIPLYATQLFLWTANLNIADGVVMYINGREVYRGNLPSATTQPVMTDTTHAATAVTGSGLTAFKAVSVASSLLVEGVNYFAFEVHQALGDTSNCVFSFTMTGDPGTPANHNAILTSVKALRSNDLVLLGATWQYDNSGVIINNFQSAAFDGSKWKTAAAPIGESANKTQ